MLLGWISDVHVLDMEWYFSQYEILILYFLTYMHAMCIAEEVSFSAAISACEKGGQWPFALFLLTLGVFQDEFCSTDASYFNVFHIFRFNRSIVRL